ncbi:hypothetical protein QR680_018194 [Steinernema hermaphroditum]|uniref:Uncharacterized protein n=1 Tax=Steinernema hermaphroditum TaxID=289476 RepID=A0AA39HH60_9BILA|nr:hypothetical protein QR680_018194 [Steinernema hermaphroditum]
MIPASIVLVLSFLLICHVASPMFAERKVLRRTVHNSYFVFEPLSSRNRNRKIEEEECENILRDMMAKVHFGEEELNDKIFNATVMESRTSIKEQKVDICLLISNMSRNEWKQLYDVLRRR